MSRTVLAVLVAAVVAGAQPDPEAWLEEDVGYIITESEREVFQSLQTADERARFITAFWAKRDSNRTTTVNEYKDEHYRRLAYANEFLGRESFVPGWRTDRGRYYILLGEPRTIQRFYGNNALKEAELWFFQGHEARGVPAFFYLLFFKPDEVGDYRLYHPIADGPTSLLRSAVTDNVAAIEMLEAIDTELAHASLSLDAGEPPDLLTGRAATGVDTLLARIDDSPKRAINTDYVEAWKLYVNRVSAEYSFNFVPNRSLFALMAGPRATPIVHFSIELDPTSFGLETDEEQSRFYTTLDVTVEVRSPDALDELVHSTAHSTFVELTRPQVEAIQTAPIAYQDDFPLVPGSYSIAVIVKNRALKNYTVAEADIVVPAIETSAPAIVDVILCHNAALSRETIAPDEVRTFQLGAMRLEPATGRTFATGEPVTVFAQVLGAPETATTKFDLLSGDNVLDSVIGSPTAELSTIGLTGGDYHVRARVVDADGTILAEKHTALTLSPRTSIPRPAFVYRRGFNTKTPGLLALVRGDQLWQLSRFAEAQEEFETAVAAMNASLPQARWKLATAYLRLGNADDALTLLTPLAESFPQQFEVMAGLGLGHYLNEDYSASVGYLKSAAEIRPPDTSLLNALGDSYQRLGDIRKARLYFTHSLELDPGQDDVRKRLEGR